MRGWRCAKCHFPGVSSTYVFHPVVLHPQLNTAPSMSMLPAKVGYACSYSASGIVCLFANTVMFDCLTPPHTRRRVFWQGSTDHRGVPGAAGRVATMVQARPDSLVWGTAYRIAGTEEQQQHILKAGITQGWIVQYHCLALQHASLCWCMVSLLY